MVTSAEPLLKEALHAYGENLRSLLARSGMSEAELERTLMRSKRKKVSTKTINNIVNGRHPPQLDNLTAIAEYFSVPLWVMFIPNLPKDLLQNPFKERFVKMVENYLSCDGDGRMHTENMAAAYAGKKRLPGT